MNSETRACLFEALICRVQAAAIRVEGMKADNKQCEYLGRNMAYTDNFFAIEAEKFEKFAEEFVRMARS